MKIIAIIPARGGSKRLHQKNVKILGGHPLIAWTIRAAQEALVISDIIVSTDDQKTADIAIQYGASVPGLRPKSLATDTANSVDVVRYVVDEYEAKYGPVDGVILLQPTSPFRSPESIKGAVNLFIENQAQAPIVSITTTLTHPAWCFKIERGAMLPFLDWSLLSKRSQELEPAYTLNGAIYLISPAALREKKAFVFEGTIPLIMPSDIESLDIDTPEDWAEAESLLAKSGTGWWVPQTH